MRHGNGRNHLLPSRDSSRSEERFRDRPRRPIIFSTSGLSLPNFWLGPLAHDYLFIQLGWMPVSGRGGLDHLVLPALTLGMGMAAILTRILRGSLLQVSSEEYVEALGLKD